MNDESIKTDLRKIIWYISDNDFEIFYNRFEKSIKEQLQHEEKNIINETQKIEDEFEKNVLKKEKYFNMVFNAYDLMFSILSNILDK